MLLSILLWRYYEQCQEEHGWCSKSGVELHLAQDKNLKQKFKSKRGEN